MFRTFRQLVDLMPLVGKVHVSSEVEATNRVESQFVG